MNTMRTALVGAFVVGGLVLFGVGLFLIGDRRLLFSPRFELTTTFGKIPGLQVGSKVRVAGLDAGEVLEILVPARPSEPFRIRMRLRDELRPLVRVDSVTAVQTDGLLGSTFIQVSRGTDAARMVEPGETIAGQDPVEFADLIADGRETFQAVTKEITEIGDEMLKVVSTLTDLTTTADDLVAAVGRDVQAMTGSGVKFMDDGRALLADTRGVVADVRAGQGTIGRVLTDDTLFKRAVSIADQAEQTVTGLRATADRARELVEGLGARDGTAQQIVQTMRDTLEDTREVMSDLSEGTEALKRNVLFRGFFRSRGFFDLDAISRDAYMAGALEGKDRTAIRVWIDAGGLFAEGADGREQLTPDGRQRLDSAMADLVRYPRDSPLVVEGYTDGTEGGAAYLLSADRAQLVRDYVLARFRRQVTLTGIMPMSTQAAGSPRGDGRWSGVALTMFVRKDALGGSR